MAIDIANPGTDEAALEAALRAILYPRGALVTRSADQTAANYTATAAIPFDSEVRDTDGIHSNTVNNTRLTVPSGVTLVRLKAMLRLANVAGDLWLHMLFGKNGGTPDFVGNGRLLTEVGNGSPALNICSALLEVAPGDYFEVFLNVETDTSISVQAMSWFEMEIVK